VYLMHGTFAGTDAAGILTELGRVFPSAQESLAKLAKAVVDAAFADNGNYVAAYARLFEEALNADGGPPIPVRTFAWSGENHHLGRADAAVRLIDELASTELPAGKRILCWGHSHAGNVFALMTNLVAGDEESINSFFRAAAWHYRVPLLGMIDMPIWEKVERRLRDGPRPIIRAPLDLVTFGTPIRYGWDVQGYDRLLHFVNHRPRPGQPLERAFWPPTPDDVRRGLDGDYVQQFGIAGTNTLPALWSWRGWFAEQRLGRLLQPDFSPLDLTARLRLGLRTPDAGRTLLVDYGPAEGSLAEHLAGHAVYTKLDWLPFHAAETARELYQTDDA
jgi:hypothetical protein